jgi:hypothetical protein
MAHFHLGWALRSERKKSSITREAGVDVGEIVVPRSSIGA